MHWEDAGPYTGEISPAMLADLDVDLVLLGHAERRHLFHETDDEIHRKARAALAHGLRVVLCVGETAAERAYGVSQESTLRQMKIALSGLGRPDSDRIVVAYEPVWSIGESGVAAGPDDVRPVVTSLRRQLLDQFGPSSGVPVLYGGSVDLDNAGPFAAMPELDGLFVGRAAWTASGFCAVLETAERARIAATAPGVDARSAGQRPQR
jgi:triosephosphate isomerase